MENVTFRDARVADVPRLVELLKHGALDHHQEDDVALRRYRSALADIGSTEGNQVLVAELGGDVVGMCQLIVFRHFQRGGGRCAEVESMHVHPDFRGSGIGAALLDFAAAVARRAGCYRIQLTSNLKRRDAHRFYERHGFVPSHVGFKLLLEPPDPPA